MASRDDSDPTAACPVDHKARAAWLEQAKQASPASARPIPHPTFDTPLAPLQQSPGCDSSQMDQQTSSSGATSSQSTTSRSPSRLGSHREISTIPRVSSSHDAQLPSSSQFSRVANSETETGADKKSGNWIYPSEQMFFDAMKRKQFAPQTADMKTIVPIHNAVNERAWEEIKAWEAGRGADACGGPRLESFSGLSTHLTPRARLNTLLGYKAPFDRHDWVVDRCGKKVEYVIDFYAGKDEARPGKELNFYLDVRPKLNTLEGWKMRMGRMVGL